MKTMKDFVRDYAEERAIPKAQAEKEVSAFIKIFKKELIEDEGIVFKGVFSIKTFLKKGRSGCMNGTEYHSPDRVSVKFKLGKEFSEELNP